MLDSLPESMTAAVSANPPASPNQHAPILCFSHLRWNFVFQRPQHLMVRFARTRTVIFFEEPLFGAGEARLETRRCPHSGVLIATPHLPRDQGYEADTASLRRLLNALLAQETVGRPIAWYYTPMMLAFTRHLSVAATVYDCMDELKNFRFAPPELLPLEEELLARADLVLTGGHSLYEAKRGAHPSVHAFPSSVDAAHFAGARAMSRSAAADQAALPGPRLGFFGVVDERMDLHLLARLADARPDWSLVIVGPVVKLGADELPQRPNIHYLGGRSYEALPSYLAGWDVALMPFALNEATRFISPTKTPEYLAGGCPVVSTAITDVERTYGHLPGVRIAHSAEAFVAACEAAIALRSDDAAWRAPSDALLATMSWDATHAAIDALLHGVATRPAGTSPASRAAAAQQLPVIRPASRRKAVDVLVVGAGFAGAVMAERLAADGGKRVLLIDKRPHIAGNAYDHVNADGLLLHEYGPHIFHTNSSDVFAYLSRFTAWRPYEHRVLAAVGGRLVPIPINRTTLNMLFGAGLTTDAAAAAFLAARAESVPQVRTSEDVVVSQVGRELYSMFFEGYTRKQWGLDPRQLDRSVTARIPTRTNTDDRYFSDTYQAIPERGYTAMFERMLDHPRITLALGADYADVKRDVAADLTVYTGPIDGYFDHRFGALPYRSLRFAHTVHDTEWMQPVATINYPSPEVPHTRITEVKHITGQAHAKTVLTTETPSAEGDPYYPIPRPENEALFKRYDALGAAETGVIFVGRLATYRYYNMDQIVGQALATYRRLPRDLAAVALGGNLSVGA